METGKAIYKLLKDSTDVGDICADRIYPELAQQDADAPFIVYTVVDTTPSPTKNATSKLDTARVELYCLSDDYEQAMDLGIAVRSALDRQSGTIAGVEVQSIDFDTSDIQFDPDQRIYVLEHTYNVRVQRTGTAQVVSQFPGNTFTVEEVDGDPTGAVNKLVVSNGTLTIDGNTATIDTGGGGASTNYELLSLYVADTFLQGGAGEQDFTGTTPLRIRFSEKLKSYNNNSMTMDNNGVTIENDGVYRVSFSAAFTSTGQRATPAAFIYVNDAPQLGTSHGYIRAATGVDHNSCNLSRTLVLSDQDFVDVRIYDSSTATAAINCTFAVLDVERLA